MYSYIKIESDEVGESTERSEGVEICPKGFCAQCQCSLTCACLRR